MKDRNIFLVTLLCSIHFFGLYYNIGQFLYYVIDLIGFGLICFIVFFKVDKRHFPNYFKNYFQLFFFSLIFSAFSCLYFHDQNLLSTLIAMRYLFYIFIYFQLRRLKISISWIEKLIIGCGLIYLLVFFAQVVLFPFKIVETGRIVETDRGLLRFRIEGAGFMMLTAFLCLNRFLMKKGYIYLFVYLVCFYGLYSLGFRTLLLTGILSTFFLIARLSKDKVNFIKVSLLMIGVFFVLFQLSFVQDFFNILLEKSQSDSELGSDYIRMQTFDFYYNKVNDNFLTLLFGNGFPQEDSKYGAFVNIGVLKGYIFADIGLIGFTIIFGFISAIILILMTLKAIFIKVPLDKSYLGVYLFYVLISSITTVEIYRIGILGILGLTFYLIELSNFNHFLQLKDKKNEN